MGAPRGRTGFRSPDRQQELDSLQLHATVRRILRFENNPVRIAWGHALYLDWPASAVPIHSWEPTCSLHGMSGMCEFS